MSHLTLNANTDLDEDVINHLQTIDQSRQHLFITGRAGTGKSTLLKHYRQHSRRSLVVLAPTGVAALNVGGQTIHSFFHFKPDITVATAAEIRLPKIKKELINNLDTIIIDEVSMVRADWLDCMDVLLREYGPEGDRAFGGIKMVFIGDLFQLPPVVTTAERFAFRQAYPTPYFFSAKVFQEIIEQEQLRFLELSTVYRQKDPDFIRVLNNIRHGSLASSDLSILNERHTPLEETTDSDLYVHLTTTNAKAESINKIKLEKLKTEAFQLVGIKKGEMEDRNLPTAFELNVKIGAQVMLLNNDPMGRWVNGTIGKLTAIDLDQNVLIVDIGRGRKVDVSPMTWEMFKFSFNEDTGSVVNDLVGSFKQFPLKLAWAVTIHKAQGKTFSKVILDLGDGAFAAGQLYVALSRCTSLKGLILTKPILARDVQLDKTVLDFMKYVEKFSS